jgi:HAD superfamily 5'-nucleotidase-like hydrolase
MTDSSPISYLVGSGSSFNSLQAIGLNISSEISSRNVIPHHLTTHTDLFCNRELNMLNVDVVGFDMDWTLAQYNEAFDLLAYNGAKEKLVSDLGYPKEVLDLKYDMNLCRRGCLIDKRRGNIIKLDRFKYVRAAEHGLTPLSQAERKSTYRNSDKDIQAIDKMIGFANIDTPFSLVDACLYVQLVDLKDRLTKDNTPGIKKIEKSYEQIYSDMRTCVDRCHKDGVIKDTVAKDPSKYITYDPNIFPMLDSFKKAGMKVFLLTNSLFDYTQVVMNYLEGRKTGENKDFKWTEYFDIIIVAGCKPQFLVDEYSLPFFRVNPTDESLINIDSIPDNTDEFLKQGKLFQGGNAQLLHKLLQLKSGDRLLYVGDHVYADVLRSKRSLGWRTCLIIPELPSEILNNKRLKKEREEIMSLRKNQFKLTNKYDSLTLLEDESLKSEIEELSLRLTTLRIEIRKKMDEYQSKYHSRWGPLFKAGFQESRFGIIIIIIIIITIIIIIIIIIRTTNYKLRLYVY